MRGVALRHCKHVGTMVYVACEVLLLDGDDHETWAEALATFRPGADARHEQFLSDPATVALIAQQGVGVVGWAWGYRQPRPDGHSMLLLYEIEVVEAHRREGVGRALLDAFLDVGRREGHSKMWLLTGEDNEAAKSLYQSAGGTVTRDDVTYSWRFE